ncbi:MAG: hypothetical protein K0R14_1183 [Burkholderiales bacterium]|jgi:hypothetical protein|nr:hypothetical protein [Burkholderiales bacterium]
MKQLKIVFAVFGFLCIFILSGCTGGDGGGSTSSGSGGGSSPAAGLSSEKAITSFSLNGFTGTINGTNITVTLPYGTSVNDLVATFQTTGKMVSIGDKVQSSGITSFNYTVPITYTVTAEDGTTQNYTLTVIVASIDSKNITAFSINGLAGTINGTDIKVMLPSGTDVTALVATFQTTGQKVLVGKQVQQNGKTPNNFSAPVIYTVVAADGTIQNYTVTVTIAASSDKLITLFSLNGVVGTISGTNIAVALPAGTNVTAIKAAFQFIGQKVMVGSTTQDSGNTPNNFSSPLRYTVVAMDGTTQNYTVTVTVPAPAGMVNLNMINNSGYPMSAEITSSSNSASCAGKVYNFTNQTWTTFTHDANVIDLPKGQTKLVVDHSCLIGGARLVIAKGTKNENFNSGTPDLATYTNIFDKIELGYPTDSDGTAVWNLTAVDFFAIPFQMTDGHSTVGIKSGETRKSIDDKLLAVYNANPGMYGNRFFGPNGDKNNFARVFSPLHFYTDIGNQWDSSIDANLTTLVNNNPNFKFQYSGFIYTNLSKPAPNTLSATCSDDVGTYICKLTGITTGNVVSGNVGYSTRAGSPAIAANFAGMIATVINRGVLANPAWWGTNGQVNSGDAYYQYWFKTGPYNEYEQVLTSVAIDNKIYATSYEDFWHMENSLQIGPKNNSVTITIMPFE